MTRFQGSGCIACLLRQISVAAFACIQFSFELSYLFFNEIHDFHW